MSEKKEQRLCQIFNCDRRRGNYCCSDCGFKKRGCKNSCQNEPEKCGKVKEG